MSCERFEAWIDQAAGGALEAVEREALERHLAGCEACRAMAAGLGRLREETAKLERSVAPGRDLWPAVRSAIESGAAGPGAARRPHRWRYGLAAAAAVALIALGAALVGRLAPPRAAPADDGASAREVVALAELRSAEAEYLRAAAKLKAVLDARKGDLPAGTRKVIEDNLEVIDRAIADARLALAREPDDPRVASLLNGLYDDRMELLERLARLAGKARSG